MIVFIIFFVLLFYNFLRVQNASGTHDKLLVADAADLTDTQIVAYPDVSLKEGINYLWCGTVALAWNEMVKLIGEKPRFNPHPAEVDLLNREDFTSADIDAASYAVIHNAVRHTGGAAVIRNGGFDL